MITLQNIIETAWDNRALLQEEITTNAIREVIALLDAGTLRVAEPTADGWQVNEWVKKAVVMYFPIQKMETIENNVADYTTKTTVNLNNKMEAKTVIKKVNPAVGKVTLAETQWKLMTINGKVIKPKGKKVYFLRLNSKGGKYVAYVGCNRFAGSYVMPSAFGIVFANTIATKMACPNMNTETAFSKALQETERYTLQDNILSLYKGPKELLATFEPVN